MKRCMLLLLTLILISSCTFKPLEKLEEKPIILGPPDEKPRISVINGVKVIQMTARQWEFIPSEINLQKGEKVRLEIKTEDVTHGIIIPDFNIEKIIEPNEITKIEFLADKKGEFEFKSNIYSGIGFQDMKGKIIIK